MAKKKAGKSGGKSKPVAIPDLEAQRAAAPLQEGGKSNAEHRFDYWQALRGGEGIHKNKKRLLKGSLLRKAGELEVEAATRDVAQPPLPPGGPGAVNWTPVGPSVVGRGQATGDPPVSGRVPALAAGPGGTRVYAGAANGGVWLTEDGGTTWTPLDDYFSSTTPANKQADSLAVGALAVNWGATTAADVVYVGTGESNQSIDSYFGIGVRRLSGGAWTLEATNLAGTWVSRLIVDPDNANLVYAAAGTGLYRRPAAAFATWTALAPPVAPANPSVTDLAVASTGAELRYYVAYMGGLVYSFDPGTSTWTQLTGIPAAANLWVCLAATRVPGGLATQRVVYALTSAGNLYRLAPGSTNFTAVAGVPPVTPGGQGWYDLAVAIEPGTSDTVWLVGDWVFTGSQYNLSLWRSAVTTGAVPNYGFTNAANPGADATYRGLGAHADGHAISFPSDGAATPVWVGCDGGVFRSTTGAAGSFQPKNAGLAITELTFLAQWPTTDSTVFLGCQDNGTIFGRAEPAWGQAQRGDGGGVTIDPNNPYRVMRQYVRGGRWVPSGFAAGLDAATDGGQSQASWSGVQFPPLVASAAQKNAVNIEYTHTEWYTALDSVFAADTAQTLTAFGSNRVWLTTDWGATWNTIPTNSNPYAGAGANLTQDVLNDPTASVAVNQFPLLNSVQSLCWADSRRLYACTGTGVWRLDRSGAATWALTALPTAGLPANRQITDIEVADAVAGAVYVTIAGAATTHVYYYSGSGSWVNCGLSAGAGNLDVPAHAAVVDPNNTSIVYVATDVGVFRGTKTGATTWTWATYSQGLPQAAVVDLAIHDRTRLLRAATHGRGLWEIELDSANTAEPELYMRVNTADTGRLSGGQRYSWVEGHPDPTRQGFNVYHWKSPDIKVRRPSLAGLPPIGSPPDFYDFAYNVGDYVDTNNAETVDAGPNRIFVQVHNRSHTAIDGSDIRVLLLLADATAGLPALPANYATNIVGGIAPSTWVGAGSGWYVGDAAQPYRSPTGSVDARVSGIANFNIDVPSLGLPATVDHICAAAFATTLSVADQLTAVELSLDALTMQDRHVVHRNLHVVAAGQTPSTIGGAGPMTFTFDVRNPTRKKATYVVELRTLDKPFELQLVATKPGLLGNAGAKITATTLRKTKRDALDKRSGAAWDRWRKALDKMLAVNADRLKNWASIDGQTERWRMIKLAKLSSLDWNAFYSTAGNPSGTISVTLGPGEFLTLVATWLPSPAMKVGFKGQLDVIQRTERTILGGSTYSLRVVKAG